MRTLTVLTLAATLAALPAAPVLAQNGNGSKSQSDSGNSKLFGHLIGAGVGALLGSQVGGGKGKLAAVAVGALAGAWLGGELAGRLTRSDQQGIAQTTNTALETGEPQSWTNPDTGVQTRVAVKEQTIERAPLESQGLRSRPWETPPLRYENAWYRALKTSNVRSGPGTDYAVMDKVTRGERVAVVGRVRGENWYLISEGGLGSGYVHASLLQRERYQPEGESPLYADAREAAGMRLAEERVCSLVTQEVTLPDGTSQSKDVRACRQPDGSWQVV